MHMNLIILTYNAWDGSPAFQFASITNWQGAIIKTKKTNKKTFMLIAALSYVAQ